jgi:hypothetical protein
MAAPVGTVLNTRASEFEEVISRKIEFFMPTLDKVWEDTLSGLGEMASSDVLGRDWVIVKHIKEGLSGVIEAGGPRGDFPIYGDKTGTSLGNKVYFEGLENTFPDPMDSPNAKAKRWAIPMRSMLANLPMTLSEIRAEASSAFIGEILAPRFEGFARNMAMTLCNYFWLNQADNYALTYLGGTTSGTHYALADSNKLLKVYLSESDMAIDRFAVGQRLQWYNSAGTTQRTVTGSTSNSVFIVVGLDEQSFTLLLREQNNLALDSTNFVSNLAANDILVFAKSKGNSGTPYAASPYFTGIAGVNSWMKFGGGGDDNYLLGGERVSSHSGFNAELDVTEWTQHRSMKVDMEGNPLTEHTFRKILRRWYNAKGKYGMEIDTLVASDGVFFAYEAQRIGRQFFDRTGTRANLTNEGGPGEFIFEVDGHRITGITSTWVGARTAYGLRRKNNWKRYCPPDIKGTTNMSQMKQGIPFRFVGKALTGGTSNQLPIFATGAGRTLVTQGVQMPGFLTMQMVPEQPCGLKFTNLAEDRYVGAKI